MCREQTKYSSREDENIHREKMKIVLPPVTSRYNGAVKDNILGNILDAARRMCKRANTEQVRDTVREDWGKKKTVNVTHRTNKRSHCKELTSARKSKVGPLYINRPPVRIALTGPNYLLRPATPTTQLYVSRLHHNTKSKEFVEYVRLKTKLTSRVEWLESRHNDIYNANRGKNLVVAPLPFRFALCRLAAVASGQTRREIRSVLELKKDADIKTCFSTLAFVLTKVMESDLTMLNKMYVNYTDDIKDDFLGDARTFGISVTKIGFNYNQAAAAFVNREFDSKTLKSIRDVLEPKDIDSNSSLLLVNGVHFKVTWESYFDLEHTKMKTFFANNKTSEVMMMNRVQACMYLDDSNHHFKAISFQLVSYGTTVMFVVPYPISSLDRLVADFMGNTGLLSDIRKRMTPKNVNVFLPRFKIKTGLDWTQYLNAAGLRLTTSRDNKGLNSILINKKASNVYVSKAKQKVFMQVDEMGAFRPFKETEGMYARDNREMPDAYFDLIPEFMGNRPFLFFVGLSKRPEFSTSPVVELVSGAYNGPED